MKSLLVDYDENGDAVGAFFWPTVEWMKYDEGPIAFDYLYDGGYVYMDFMYNKYTKRHYVKNLTFFRYTGIRNNDLYIDWLPDYAEQ